jgi:hypothetical protein
MMCINSTRKTSGNDMETFNTEDTQCLPLRVLSSQFLSLLFYSLSQKQMLRNYAYYTKPNEIQVF